MSRTSKFTLQQIIQMTLELVDERGVENLSLSLIAQELKIKTPSLYNYFSNLEDLKLLLSSQIHVELFNTISDSIVGLDPHESLLCIASSYRVYAVSYPERYKLSVYFPNNISGEAAIPFLALRDLFIDCIKSNFCIDDKDCHLLARAVRSQLHGFISLELSGGWSTIAEADETFNFGMKIIINEIISFGKKEKKQREFIALLKG